MITIQQMKLEAVCRFCTLTILINKEIGIISYEISVLWFWGCTYGRCL